MSRSRPVLLGLAGWSGSGKTTLLCGVLPILRRGGLRVSTIKHAHHAVDLDRPGKDSFRHREAGAEEVLLVGDGRWALMRETPEAPPNLNALAGRLAPVDLVLVEGFRFGDFPRLEVYRPSVGKPPLWPDDPDILAVVTDSAPGSPALARCDRLILPLNDVVAIARWIGEFAATHGRGA